MNITKGISHKQRRLLVYDAEYNCYDGKKYFRSNSDKIKKYSLTNSYRSKYIPIYIENGKSLQHTFDDFVELANELRKDSDCIINLYKTGSYTKTALKIFFDHCNKNNICPDPISMEESRWIELSSTGAIMYANDEYEGSSYKYDVCSFYPSIMRSDKFKIPIKKGVFQKLSQEDFNERKNTFFRYGIYRAKVIDNGLLKTRKLFRFNKNNFYTTQDLRLAKRLGLKMNIIDDGYDNFLFYGKNCMVGTQLFKPFVDMLYGLKDKNKKFKIILNVLWGLLCSRNIKKIQYNVTREFNYDFDTEKVEILNQYLNDDIMKIEYIYRNKPYKYNYARVKPFLLASGRYKLVDTIFEHQESIEQIHTDGWISSQELNIQTGIHMGDVKFEGFDEHVRIEHINKIIKLT